MTPAEIAKLRDLFTEPERSLVSEPFTDEMARLSNAYVLAVEREQAHAARAAIPRLLAEREALADALEAGEKAYARLCCGECGCRWGEEGDCDVERGIVCCTCSACREPRDAINTARAALRKAGRLA